MENRKKVELIRRKYPIGTRIKLNYMKDDYPVPSGTCGTVDYVDAEGNIGMKCENITEDDRVDGLNLIHKVFATKMQEKASKNVSSIDGTIIIK